MLSPRLWCRVCVQYDVQEMRGDVMKGLLNWLLYGQWSYR